MLSPQGIERRARQLLKDAAIAGPPVNVQAVARHLGAVVRLIKPDKSEADISGAVLREGRRVIIGVNATHPTNRKRFTIAHEIGHLVLHDAEAQVDHRYAEVASREKIQLAALRSRVSSEAIDPREIDANRFAAALLMPAHFLEESLKDLELPLSGEDITALARDFKVSAQAMTFRLINLGIPVDVAGA